MHILLMDLTAGHELPLEDCKEADHLFHQIIGHCPVQDAREAFEALLAQGRRL